MEYVTYKGESKQVKCLTLDIEVTMKVLVFAVLVATTLLPHNLAVPFQKRIVGGKPAQRGQFPWQVVNRYTLPIGVAFGAGALISPQWVLTAGHCVKGANSFHITLGTLISDVEEEEGKVMITTTKAILHENYNPLVLHNDIGLIDLERKVAFTDVISPIVLGTWHLNAGVSLTISGWGKTSDNTTLNSLRLNYLEMITITNKKCYETFDNVIDEMVCCSGENSKSTCGGDSGGALVQKLPNGSWIHVGVMSFVHKQGCTKGYPTAYTRTSSYRTWIKKNSGI